MTCIAGFIDRVEGRVHMAADSETSCGRLGEVKIRNEKLHSMNFGNRERVVFAAAGRSAISKIIHAHLNLTRAPIHRDPHDVQRWAQATAEAITDLCVNAGLKDSDGDMDGVVMFAWRDNLWEINHHSALAVDSYAAIGQGDAAAMGAFYALRETECTSEARVRIAVAAAIEHLAGLSGPISHLTTLSGPGGVS